MTEKKISVIDDLLSARIVCKMPSLSYLENKAFGNS
jgi:hypothetical protein